MNYKAITFIFIGIFSLAKSYGQSYKITRFSFDIGGGQFVNNGFTSLNEINTVLKNDKFIPLNPDAKNENFKFYTQPTYYLGYFLRIQNQKLKNHKSDWGLGLAFNSTPNLISYSTSTQSHNFKDSSNQNYIFLEENRSFINLIIEKSFYSNWIFKRVRFTAGAGGSFGYSYVSNYLILEHYLKNDSGRVGNVSQQKTADARNKYVSYEYLTAGFQLKLKENFYIDFLSKVGLYQTIGKYPIKNHGYYGFGLLRISWGMK